MKKSYLLSLGSLVMLSSIVTPVLSQNPVPPPRVKFSLPVADKSDSRLSNHLRLISGDQNTERVNGRAKPGVAINNKAMDSLLQRYNDRVVIDVTVTGDMAVARQQLTKAGATITGNYGRILSALIPVRSLPLLEQASQLRFIRPAYRPHHQVKKKSVPAAMPQSGVTVQETGSTLTPWFLPPPVRTVYSQGDTAQGSDIARKKSKVNGKGVKIGILSDSYNNENGAATGIRNGELPGPGNPYKFTRPVEVLQDLPTGGIDEGRAMAEIVHDVAPGAELAFNTALLGQGAFAQGIINLADRGCKVITDDILYYAEPFFQDGIIAQAVDKVKSKGVTYFSAAGNAGNISYESVYRESTDQIFGEGAGTAHNFASGQNAPVYFQKLFVPQGGVAIISFQWAQPSFSAGGDGAETDLDFYVIDESGNLVAVANDGNIGSGDPFELTGFVNNTAGTTFYVSILKYAGVAPPRVKYIMYGAGTIVNDEPSVPGVFSPTIVGHANSAGAIATGAAWYRSTPAYGQQIPLIQSYSSLGGVAIYFDKSGKRIAPVVRKKPELTAPDGANTSFFQSDDFSDDDDYPNFYGTSAAAPHAAGVAALMIEAQKLKSITPEQIRGVMMAQTYDMDNIYTPRFDKGFDYNTGAGLVRAERAVAAVKFPNLYLKNLDLHPVCSDDPSKSLNWKITNPNVFDVKINWFVAGSLQQSSILVPPGNSYFSTRPIYFRNRPLPTVVVLNWEDNFGFTRFDLNATVSYKCNQQLSSTQTLGDQSSAYKPEEAREEIAYAEVFPNPASRHFRLYLSLPDLTNAEVSLFSQDGKLLLRNNVAGKGVHDFDVSRYPAGLYLMSIRQGDYHKSIKLIKQ